ncbi:MAG: methyltransferase domain-containing protein [Prolixibacteraceae bacterium]|nr:methyltransferase domain-containing protein [Prolixibacteraceae bacterium]MBN2774409.1 methyltransferase domain-containing protein [Prolixibacteraceae bacterium]
MNRGKISNILRALHILYLIDWLHFRYEKIKYRKTNNFFCEQNPEVKLPPDYLLYESYQLNYKKYFTDGVESAQWLVDHLSKHVTLEGLKILDWGCGPGRLVRHLPLLTESCEFYGSDYNQKSIEWCKDNLSEISFNLNPLNAELPYPDNFFDIIYGYSVLTHLSEEKHREWYAELFRVLKPGGILFLTAQGKHYRIKLTEKEKKIFDLGDLVVRGKVKEGHRTYSAFHPESYMLKLFTKAEVLEHIEPEPVSGRGIPQDIWIIKKTM